MPIGFLLHDRFRGPLRRASEPLTASPLLQPESDPPKGGEIVLEKTLDVDSDSMLPLNVEGSGEAHPASRDEYVQLQRRIFLTTLALTVISTVLTAIFFDFQSSLSLLVGAFFGVIYLRLLARSVGKLGKSSKSVGKIQLLLPALLVIAVSKLPDLALLPSLLGFLLYKPSLILQCLLES